MAAPSPKSPEPSVRIGVSLYGIRPREVVALVRRAQDLGFHRACLGEHVLAPVGYETRHPTQGELDAVAPLVDPDVALADPLATAAALGATSTRIHITTGVYLLALRHPLATARAVATVADLAPGRFELGVGAGWLREEFDALQVPFTDRAHRLDEALEVVRAALAGGPVAHRGRCFTFDDVVITPDPVAVPLIVGGSREGALRRAARAGDGWYTPSKLPLDDALRCRDRIEELRSELGTSSRPFVYRAKLEPGDPGQVDRWVAEGFDDLVIAGAEIWPQPNGTSLDEKVEGLERTAQRFGL